MFHSPPLATFLISAHEICGALRGDNQKAKNIMTIQNTVRMGLCTLITAFPLLALAGPAADSDGDGVANIIDNCSSIPNAGTAGCDSDLDGYGNLCDGDFNNDLSVDGADFSPTFLSDFAGGTMSLNGNGDPNGSDMNCDAAVDGADFNPPFIDQFIAGTPGPSGLACAGLGGPCL